MTQKHNVTSFRKNAYVLGVIVLCVKNISLLKNLTEIWVKYATEQLLSSMNVCTQETFKSHLGRAWGRRNNVVEAFILNKESRNINLNEWSMVTFLEPFFQLCGGFKCANMLNLRTWKVTSKPKMLQSVEFRNKLLHSNMYSIGIKIKNRRYFIPRSHHTSLLSCQFFY